MHISTSLIFIIYKQLLLLLTFIILSGCSTTFGNKSAAERFSDKSVQQLVRASEQGDVDKIDYLLEQKGVDVNATGEGGTTPLIWAMSAKNYRGTEALLKHGANPNQEFEKGYTPMWYVSGGDSLKLLELLLKHGGDPNQWKDTRNMLMQALWHERIENYKLLLQYGADINNTGILNRNVATYAATMDKYDTLYQILNDGYSHDLVGLAQLVEKNSIMNSPEQKEWLEKVVVKLKELGVKYPLPPELESEPIRLSAKTRERLERWEKEGKLPPNSQGAKRLDLDRSLDK